MLSSRYRTMPSSWSVSAAKPAAPPVSTIPTSCRSTTAAKPRHLLHRHGVLGGAVAQGDHPQIRAPQPDLLVSVSVQILEPCALRTGGRHPSGYQAAEHHHRRRRPGEGHRLRHRPGGQRATMTEAGSILERLTIFRPSRRRAAGRGGFRPLFAGRGDVRMATGKLPFDGDNPVGIAMQHVHERPVAPGHSIPRSRESGRRHPPRLGKQPTTAI